MPDENNMNCSCTNMGNNCNCKMMQQMMNQIQATAFTITDISLYLDTHPEDRKMLYLHRRYCNQLRNLKDNYQKMFGPLSINCPCNKWRWIEEPWPWEGSVV